MNKKFLTICFLMPVCFTGCSKNGNSKYLDTKATVALLNSIKDYRSNHQDEFKLDSKCSARIIADTYLEEITAFDHESMHPLGGDRLIRCDFDNNVFISETDAFLNLGPKLSGHELMTDLYFIDKNDENKGIYVRGSESKDDEEFLYWDADLSNENGKAKFESECKNDVINGITEQAFGIEQIDTYIQYMFGNFEGMHLLFNSSLAFASTKAISSGKGCLDISITGFTRGDTRGNDPIDQEGDILSFDTMVNATIKIENYMTTKSNIEVFTAIMDDVVDDATGKISFAGGSGKMLQSFEYFVGCDPISIPDYSTFEYRGHLI